MLEIYDKLHQRDGQVAKEFKAKLEEDKELSLEQEVELQHAQVVQEAKFFDQLYWDKGIDERAYFLYLEQTDMLGDPRFRMLLAKHEDEAKSAA